MALKKTIRIGTRDSELALWQAHHVEDKLKQLGYSTEIIAVKSQGDIVLDKPLYELGITGIFTKTLDIAMLNNEIDIAVHSLKDVPTKLPIGIVQAAVLERANTSDILVHNGNLNFLDSTGTIATGSLRRKAQWLHQYPTHQVVDLRGNVNTRLQKLKDNNWDAAIFASAGLERINLKPSNFIDLNWMIPAPAQGAVVVVAMGEDSYALNALSEINHIETEITTYIERQFLSTLEGGCTAPIGALAKFIEADDTIHLVGGLFSLDGSEKIIVDEKFPIEDWRKIGYNAAQVILKQGGDKMMQSIKETIKKEW